MSVRPSRPPLPRRAFLRGVAGTSLALPFLESLPDRSAWAADQTPIFSFFLCAANGVLPEQFFPDEVGPLTPENLLAANKATSKLATHAERLLFVQNLGWPLAGPRGCSHAEALCQVLTGMEPMGSGNTATAAGPSADSVIADRVQPGVSPLSLYAGNRRNGYIAERLSFVGPGEVRTAADNPYQLYLKLITSATPPSGGLSTTEEAARLHALSRNSINDLVRDELNALMGNTRLSSADKQRLELHFDAIRDVEVTMDDMGNETLEACTVDGLELTKLQALESGYTYSKNGQVEEIVRLHMQLVALAFACNLNRTATLQWGDGTDQTIYAVPSNERAWGFHYVSHRVQSDGSVGDDALAETAHGEIDAVRMETLAAGLDHFAERGLADRCFVLWTNQIADGPSHAFRNVPHIIWGNAGGHLKQGELVDAAGAKNNQLLNALISAAIRDTGTTVEDFGEGTPGQLAAVLA